MSRRDPFELSELSANNYETEERSLHNVINSEQCVKFTKNSQKIIRHEIGHEIEEELFFEFRIEWYIEASDSEK